MKISVFGLGYVGTVSAACLADRGHQVVGIEKSEIKAGLVQSGRSPIVERDIDELVKRTAAAGRLTATSDANDAVADTDMSLICVGTPSRSDGSPDLSAIAAVLNEIGHAIRAKTTRHYVVVRSTVVPGTMRDLVTPRLAEACGNVPFSVAYNPEFLREGSAVADFNMPPKTIVGAADKETADVVMSLYEHFPGRKIITELETAELVKYVDNAWHALKVAFGNEVGVIANRLGINSQDVMDIFFADKKLNISAAYLRPGFAFGGSCLPKDLRTLSFLGRKLDLSLPVLNHVLDSNQMLIEQGVDWILGQSKKRIAFLGISFKSGTDDVRESPFVEMVKRLIGKGRAIRIFDPNVQLARIIGANKEHLMRVLPHIAELMVAEVADAVGWAETIVVTTTDPAYVKAIAAARSDQIVLDFAHLNGTVSGDTTVLGFLW
jgi:GDP-mannose 6-dehydrogenase